MWFLRFSQYAYHKSKAQKSAPPPPAPAVPPRGGDGECLGNECATDLEGADKNGGEEEEEEDARKAAIRKLLRKNSAVDMVRDSEL